MTTPRPEQFFGFVRDYFDEHGFAPTLDEMAKKFGISSPAVWKNLQALIRQGRLERGHGGSRALAIPGRVDLAPVPTSALEAELERRRRDMPAVCGECGARPHDPAARSCTRSDCPLAKPADQLGIAA